MPIYVGTNIHHMILSHFSIYAMNIMKAMTIYVVLNKHCENSYKVQLNFNYFDARPSKRI